MASLARLPCCRAFVERPPDRSATAASNTRGPKHGGRASVDGMSTANPNRCRIVRFGIMDALADLHASVSLLRQGRCFLPHVVADARVQQRSWSEIAFQLQISPADAQRRYGA